MVGSGMKVSHQSMEDVANTTYYFPKGMWCSVFNVSAGCIDGPAEVNLPSRVYQFFAHIKDGSILPLQTGLIGHFSNVSTTWDVQQNPIDLHIHPGVDLNENNTGHCNASGRFLNDDGEVLDYVGYQNRYVFNFSSTCSKEGFSTDIRLDINTTDKADLQFKDVGYYNMSRNDFLGQIFIYNAYGANFEMDATYNVTVGFVNNTTKTLGVNAEFQPASNQTVFPGVDDMDLALYEMKYIEFAKLDK